MESTPCSPPSPGHIQVRLGVDDGLEPPERTGQCWELRLPLCQAGQAPPPPSQGGRGPQGGPIPAALRLHGDPDGPSRASWHLRCGRTQDGAGGVSRRLAPSAAVGKPGELSLSEQNRWWSQGPEMGRAARAGEPETQEELAHLGCRPAQPCSPRGAGPHPHPLHRWASRAPGGSSAPSLAGRDHSPAPGARQRGSEPTGFTPCPGAAPSLPLSQGRAAWARLGYLTQGERDRGPGMDTG